MLQKGLGPVREETPYAGGWYGHQRRVARRVYRRHHYYGY